MEKKTLSDNFKSVLTFFKKGTHFKNKTKKHIMENYWFIAS